MSSSRRLAAVTSIGLLLGAVTVSRVSAAPAPMEPRPAVSVTADALPTTQIDGVVWSQATVGNIVYAGGRFNNARPAGAAAGTNLTARGNLLAYDITTGNLVTSFAPNLNAQVLGVAASPDGSRIYVVGDFTTANGTARRRIAAYSTATGQLITSFNPTGVNSQARAVVATNSTVYVGGGFAGAGNVGRNNLAAFRASDGALLDWNPSADYTVWALAISDDGSAVFAGGSFQNVGGVPAYGLAKIDAATGSVLPWNATNTVRNAGPDAGITSLHTQNGFVYGTTYHFGPGGNLEGNFKASAGTGDVQWITDCHGDQYSNWVSNGIVYSVGHSHYCGNMGGGFPQYPSWKFQHAQAWNDTVTGPILNDVHGYPNHAGFPGPAMVAWLPEMAIGNFTGQYQSGWNVTGNDNYVAIGGEFPRVNGTGQQGLVRYAVPNLAPKKQGPQFVNNSFAPAVRALTPTSVRVSWRAGFDRDDLNLEYKVRRSGTVVNTQTASSTWWNVPTLGFVDTGLQAGKSYSYLLTASDPNGNIVYSSTVSVTTPTTNTPNNAYSQRVLADGARIYWPLNDAAGSTTALDKATWQDAVNDGYVTYGQQGAIAGDGAAQLNSSDPNQFQARITQVGDELAPDTFTAQVWVNSTTTSGGRIFGFGDLDYGNSGHRDRHIYMDNAGRITFGVRAADNSTRTLSSGRSYNDGQWHQVTATMDNTGMKLYVDGIRVGKRADTTQGETYLGFWRLGGDNLDGWPNQPALRDFHGLVDEAAVYPTALTQDQIVAQYVASGRQSVIPPAPTDAYGAMVYTDDPDIFWRLGETSGTVAHDAGRSMNDGTYFANPTLGEPGVVAGNTAAGFDGVAAHVSSDAQFSNPTVYSTETWFKTTTTSGGKLLGFGDQRDGNSGNYDRHIYMLGNGQLMFGVWTGQMNTITTAGSFNDGQWHHVVATQGADGMKLYVDAVLQGTNPQTQAQPYNGYWRAGGDSPWGGDAYFDGSLDEIAVYSTVLSAQRVTDHFVAGGGHLNEPPSAAFTATVNARTASFDGTASSDSDGSVVAYSWDFGDGSQGAGPTVTHAYPVAGGTFTATLTVTDNKGATGSVGHTVTVAATPAPTDAYGAAVFNDSPTIFWRFAETSGNLANDASGASMNGTYYGGYTLGRPGALPGTNPAVEFDGWGGHVSSNAAFTNPTVYSTEAWFKTATTSGGKIVGFGNQPDGNSSNYDRHIYMDGAGAVTFGVWTGQANTITSPSGFNDSQWHHVVATQGPDGMKLYLDGVLVGSNPQTQAQDYTGYWRVGGDSTWGGDNYFDGLIDEVAIYPTVLSGGQVVAHHAAAQPAPNQPPAAAFTHTETDLLVELDASGSTDPDGSIANYSWDFGDGTTSTGAIANHTYTTGGTYAITLTVADDRGATNSVVHSVTVVAPNQAPTAAISGSSDFLTATLDATASSDPDGSIVGYTWDFGDGATGTGATVSHTYAAAGTYTVTVTVTDNRGGTATASAIVNATRPPNVAPTASFTNTATDLVASFDGSASSDTDGTIAGYAWSFGDGATGTGATAAHTYAAAGTYTVSLTVTDNDGASGSVSHDITVVAANVAPVAQISATPTNLTVAVDGSASSDPDGTIASYAWSFGDGATGTGATASHSYAMAGTYTVTLTVTDDRGATGTASVQVAATQPPNVDPTASFTSSVTDLSASFDGAASSDPDGSIVSYSWTFGDGANGSGATATHVYASAGTYTVTLTVTDNRGGTSTATRAVTVTAPAFLAADSFGRTLVNGWGSADVGGAWTLSGGGANFAVTGAVGTVKMAAGSGPSAYLNSVNATNVDLSVAFGLDKPGTGGGVYTSLVARRIGTSDYRVKVRVTATATALYLVRTLNGVETTLSSQTVPGLVYNVGDVLNLRLQVTGTGTTTVAARIWKSGAAEPLTWSLTGSDTTAALQNPGAVGVYTYLSASATNGPVTMLVDNLRVSAL